MSSSSSSSSSNSAFSGKPRVENLPAASRPKNFSNVASQNSEKSASPSSSAMDNDFTEPVCSDPSCTCCCHQIAQQKRHARRHTDVDDDTESVEVTKRELLEV